MEEKKLWELIGKRVAGEADPGELEELNRLLEKFPEALYTLETMENYWKGSAERSDREIREAALDRHLQRLERQRPPRLQRNRPAVIRYLLIAASTAAACAGLYFLSPALRPNHAPSGVTGAPVVKVSTQGHRRRIDLPDGSVVWLNAGTTVSYPANYGQDSIRSLSLDGEAFFKVRHDAKHPFVVHIRQMEIQDIGTSFNVKAYATDGKVEATLVEGAIEVKWKNRGKKILMNQPNEKCTVFTATAPERDAAPVSSDSLRRSGIQKTDGDFKLSMVRLREGDSLSAETAWLHDALVFHNEAFSDIALQLERKYEVGIRFTSPLQANYRFTGVFTHETLDQALQELQLMRPFHFTRKDKTITITQ